MIVNTDYEIFRPEGMDGVEVEVKPLELWAYQHVARLLPKIMPKDRDLTPENVQEVDAIQAFERIGAEEVLEAAKKVLPGHVGKITGIQVKKAGSLHDATVEDLLAYGAFLAFDLTLLMHLFQISSVTEAEAKN